MCQSLWYLPAAPKAQLAQAPVSIETNTCQNKLPEVCLRLLQSPDHSTVLNQAVEVEIHATSEACGGGQRVLGPDLMAVD
jgi:hypothetical protein